MSVHPPDSTTVLIVEDHEDSRQMYAEFLRLQFTVMEAGDGIGALKMMETQLPDVVITDFEPMTAYLAQRFDLPLITIDNQHRMRYLKYKCPRGLKVENRVTRSIVRAMVPRPDASLVIAFAASEVRRRGGPFRGRIRRGGCCRGGSGRRVW